MVQGKGVGLLGWTWQLGLCGLTIGDLKDGLGGIVGFNVWVLFKV